MDWYLFALMTVSFASAAAFGFAAYAMHHSLESRIEVEAMKRSTHQIQFVPAEAPTTTAEDREEAELNRAFEKDQARATSTLSAEDLEDDSYSFN